MKFRVIYLPQTIKDREEIKSYLSQFYKGTSKRFFALLKTKISMLKNFPLSCPAYEGNSRYRKLVVGDYLVFYVVHENAKVVEIHYIIHGSRNLTNLLD